MENTLSLEQKLDHYQWALENYKILFSGPFLCNVLSASVFDRDTLNVWPEGIEAVKTSVFELFPELKIELSKYPMDWGKEAHPDSTFKINNVDRENILNNCINSVLKQLEK